MGAVFAGAARAPITAVLIMFELTGEYTIILPLMLAIVLATGVSRALSRDSIYTLKLRRRGIEIDARAADPRLTDRTVGDIMEPPPPALADTVPLEAAARRLLSSGRGSLPVVTDGPPRGSAPRRPRGRGAARTRTSPSASRSPTRSTTCPGRTPRRRCAAAWTRYAATSTPTAASRCVDDEDRLVGWVTHRTLLRTLTAPLPVVPAAPPGTALARLRGRCAAAGHGWATKPAGVPGPAASRLLRSAGRPCPAAARRSAGAEVIRRRDLA